MKQELTDRYPPDSLSVLVVWSPMMDDDNEKAARQAAKMFGSSVKQFYDPKRLVGTAYREQVFPYAALDAVESLPDGHWLKTRYPEVGESFATRPEWEIYLYYAPGTLWRDGPTPPTHFIRHIGRFGEGDEQRSVFWVNSYEAAPREGDLAAAIRALVRELMTPGTAGP